MALVPAAIHEIPRSCDRNDSEYFYEQMWQQQLPGFITPKEAILAPPKLTHIKLVERSAAWLSHRLPGCSIEAQQQDVWPDDSHTMEDIGPHIDGTTANSGDVMWRTNTYIKGRAAVFLAHMNPEFLTCLKAQGLNMFQIEHPIQEALLSVQERIAVDGMVDDSICRPDIYEGQLTPGDSITFTVGSDSCAHDFVTLGSESRKFYEASARFFAGSADTIRAHELLEGTQPAL